MNVGTGEAVPPPLPDSAAPDAALQTPGALLQQERIRRGLSVQQSAEGLHLDTWIIEAIEANRFLALGAPVYAKGYLRKYAVLLGLAPDVILTRYEALGDTPLVPTPIPVITTTPPPRPRWPKYLAWSLLVALIIAIGVVAFELLMPERVEPAASKEPEPTPSSVSAPAPALQPQMVPAPAPATATPTAIEQPRVTQPAPVATQVEAPRSVPVAPMASTPAVAAEGPLVRLRLEFSEASWVEVYDAGGQRLLYDVGQPNRPRVVSGTAPLNVVVGVASAVTVQVNGDTIVVPRRANRDSTRFRIAADGSVQ